MDKMTTKDKEYIASAVSLDLSHLAAGEAPISKHIREYLCEELAYAADVLASMDGSRRIVLEHDALGRVVWHVQ